MLACLLVLAFGLLYSACNILIDECITRRRAKRERVAWAHCTAGAVKLRGERIKLGRICNACGRGFAAIGKTIETLGDSSDVG